MVANGISAWEIRISTRRSSGDRDSIISGKEIDRDRSKSPRRGAMGSNKVRIPVSGIIRNIWQASIDISCYLYGAMLSGNRKRPSPASANAFYLGRSQSLGERRVPTIVIRSMNVIPELTGDISRELEIREGINNRRPRAFFTVEYGTQGSTKLRRIGGRSSRRR